MITDRGNTICLLEILKEFSDSEHILTMKEILSKMNAVYGIKPDRRTVYSAVSLLTDMGYEISAYEDNGKGYYLQSRDFEETEIMLLTDAVHAFPFIPARQTEQLIAKLQKELSIHKRKKYRHLTVVRQEHKTDNRQVFLNLEILDEAISAKKQVNFTYLDYGTDKKLHPRREELYTVNPYGLVYTNEHYYLICSYAGSKKTSLYRLDLIRDIEQSEADIDRFPEDKSEISEAVYAFSGKPERVKIRCDRGILKDVIDRFGSGIRISEADEEHFTASFKAPPFGIKFWALQYLPYAEVTEPEWLREEIIKSITENKYGVWKILNE